MRHFAEGAFCGLLAAIVVGFIALATAHGEHGRIDDPCEHDCLHRVYEPCARGCNDTADPSKCWMGCVRLHHDCFEGCQKKK